MHPLRNETSADAKPLGANPSFGADELAIDTRNVTLSYPGAPAVLEDVNLRVGKGEILAIIGPSGCGKSTVLNLIAGLLKPSKGEVRCFGKQVRGLNRRVTYMTQKDTLLAWRQGIDNVALPLEIKGVPRPERHERARAEMIRVGVEEAEFRRPHQLSGGMRARLSLARALLSDSDIFLMDEPFAAVDALRRVKLQQLLVSLWESTRKTLVYVTHDLNEAISLGHRVLVMSAHPGQVFMEKAVSTPHPRDVARFHATPEAEKLYVELWDGLEKQFDR